MDGTRGFRSRGAQNPEVGLRYASYKHLSSSKLAGWQWHRKITETARNNYSRSGNFTLHHLVHMDFGAHPAFYRVSNGYFLHG
jgi:hypothetical protein